jgi:hypothetical protein
LSRLVHEHPKARIVAQRDRQTTAATLDSRQRQDERRVSGDTLALQQSARRRLLVKLSFSSIRERMRDCEVERDEKINIACNSHVLIGYCAR